MNSKNQQPFKYMLNNKDVIINFINNSKSASEAWKKLSSNLPDLKRCMKFNTFKVYSKILVIVSFLINNYKNLIIELKKENKVLMKNIDTFNARELNLNFRLNEAAQKDKERLCLIDKVRHELDEISLENSKVKKELDKVRQNFYDKINENSQLKSHLDSTLKVKHEIHLDLTEVRQRLIKISTEKSTIKAELDKIKSKLSKLVKSQDTNIIGDSVPKRINGWGVQFKYPYYRIFKKINGKVKWIYIGKKFSTELVLSKIDEFFKNNEG